MANMLGIIAPIKKIISATDEEITIKVGNEKKKMALQKIMGIKACRI